MLYKRKTLLLASLILNIILLMGFLSVISRINMENDIFFKRMIEAELKGKKYYFGKDEEDFTAVEKSLRKKWDKEINFFKKTLTKKEYFSNKSFIENPFSDLMEDKKANTIPDK